MKAPLQLEKAGFSRDGSWSRQMEFPNLAPGVLQDVFCYALEHHARYGGSAPPTPLAHDGIQDAFVEKASVIWYWHQGRWLQLTGAN